MRELRLAMKAEELLGFAEIDVLADTGYFDGPDLLACHEITVEALVRHNTSQCQRGRALQQGGVLHLPGEDAYRCSVGEMLTPDCLTKEYDLTLIVHRTTACIRWPLKERCTAGTRAPPRVAPLVARKF